MPKGFDDYSEPEDWLSFDELERVIAVFGKLGVKRVRLTGGEPLVRKDLPLLAKRLSQLPGIEDLSLSTNAVRLKKQAQGLADAGIARINVSLDSLNPELFKTITSGKLSKVIDGLMAAKEAGLNPVKINMVIMKGINDHEVEDMVEFCLEHGFTLRFIETMPLGDTGRNATDHYMPLSVIRERLEKRYNLVQGVMPGGGPAKYMRVVDTDLRIGFITPMSQHFCETCNRVRLSAEGTLYLCLGQEDKLELRPLLRNGVSDDDLEKAIVDAILRKPEKHEFKDNPSQLVRIMSMTGG